MQVNIPAELGAVLLALLALILGVFKFGDSVLRRLTNQRLATLDKYEHLLEEAAKLRGDNQLLTHRATEAEKRASRYSSLVTQYQFALRQGYSMRSVSPPPMVDLVDDLTDTDQIATLVTDEKKALEGEPNVDTTKLVTDAIVHDMPPEAPPRLHSEPPKETNG